MRITTDQNPSAARRPTRSAWRNCSSVGALATAMAMATLLAACGGGGEVAEEQGRAGPLAAARADAAPVVAAADPVTNAAPATPQVTVSTFATGLANPWGLAFMPDGRMLVTEKAGRLRIVASNGALSAPILGLPTIFTGGQGGLLDVAVGLDFATTRRIFLAYAESGTGADAGRQGLAVGTAQLSADGSALQNWRVIFRQLPKVNNGNHFGGRLVLAPGSLIYITTGDRFSSTERGNAQLVNFGHGKVFRLAITGSPLRNNPFASNRSAQPGIWSLGHRNVQGAALRPVTGELWTTEHGPQGGDELNRTLGGQNFGWPLVSFGCEYGAPVATCTPVGGATSGPGFTQPVSYWVPISIAPSGLAIHSGNGAPQWRGDFFMGALAGRALWHIKMNGNEVVSRTPLLTELNERIRDVREGPDGMLYVLTDNSAGRILRVTP